MNCKHVKKEEQCRHRDTIYCSGCNKIYCEGCGKEWGEPCEPYPYIYPYIYPYVPPYVFLDNGASASYPCPVKITYY